MSRRVAQQPALFRQRFVEVLPERLEERQPPGPGQGDQDVLEELGVECEREHRKAAILSNGAGWVLRVEPQNIGQATLESQSRHGPKWGLEPAWRPEVDDEGASGSLEPTWPGLDGLD